jgi:hypothetical protein
MSELTARAARQAGVDTIRMDERTDAKRRISGS